MARSTPGAFLRLPSADSPRLVNRPISWGMKLDLTEEEAAALLRELDHIIDSDRYFLSPRIQTLKAMRSKMRPETERDPLPPLKHYEPPRVSVRRRR